MRVLFSAAIAAVAMTCLACGGHNANPNAPTSMPGGAAAITISGGSTGSARFQLTATARLANGASQDVTSSAVWTSSNTAIATVSAGLVTAVGSGEIDVHATYQGATGSMHLLITRMKVTSIVVSGAAASGNFQLT